MSDYCERIMGGGKMVVVRDKISLEENIQGKPNIQIRVNTCDLNVWVYTLTTLVYKFEQNSLPSSISIPWL